MAKAWKMVLLGLGLCVIVGCVLLFWVFAIEPKMLDTRQYTVEDNALAGLNVVYITDLHVGPKQKERLQEVVRHANALKPDLILLGGDYVKGRHDKTTLAIEVVAEELGKLQAPLGVYTVLGNHDMWYGQQRVIDAFEKNGIPVLENKNVLLQKGDMVFYLAGVQDLWEGKPDIAKALQGVTGPVLLLSHNPDLFPKVPENVSLTLAGHTHGGQVVFPFIGALFIPAKREYASGRIVEGNKTMLVSTGIGTSILPVRFNCVPEVVNIQFVEKKTQQ